MQTNNHKIVDYDAVLDAKFGKVGTPERARAEEAAYSFYSGQIIDNAVAYVRIYNNIKISFLNGFSLLFFSRQ